MTTSNGHTLYVGTSDGAYVVEPSSEGYTARANGLQGMGDMRAPIVQDCGDPSVLYAGTIKAGMRRSRDVGESWEPINNGLMHQTVWSITQDTKTGRLYVGTSPATVFVSDDQGDNWSELGAMQKLPETKGWTGPVPPHVSRMKWIALSPDTPPAIYGAIEEGWAVRSLDGGETWEQIADGVDQDGHAVAVVPNEPNVIVAATGKGMFRTTDRGAHWEPTSDGLEGRKYTAAPVVSHPGRPGYLLTGVTAVGPGRWSRPEGGDSGFARSEDGGRTWKVSTKGLPSPCVGIPRGLAFAPDDADLCFAGLTDGTVWRSGDAGVSFEKVLDGLPGVLSLTVSR